MKLKCSALLLLIFCAACSSQVLQVDDGYTPGQRMAANQAKHPELRWPVLEFESGQTVQFERVYKSLENRDLHLDIFSPAEAHNSHQAIILIHGGGWRAGNKSNFYPLANLLAQRGYTVLLPEYRLSIEAQYPAGLVDINDAIVWAKQHAKALNFNADRVAIGGGSSGAQMAALIGFTSHKALFQPSVSANTHANAVIVLDGVLDFTTPLALQFENQKKEQSAAALWLGGSYEKMPMRWKEASAISHLDVNSPPTLVISSGQARFTAGREALKQQLDELGIPNQYIQQDTIHTFWLFEPYLSKTADWIHAFMQRLPASNTQITP